MGSTKKLGAAARFGARYGLSVKRRWLKVHVPEKSKHNCPNCSLPKIKRLDSGIYLCKKCNLKFAGGTFLPETLTGSLIKKMVEQKQFMPLVAELLEATEKVKGYVAIETEAKKSEAEKVHEQAKTALTQEDGQKSDAKQEESNQADESTE